MAKETDLGKNLKYLRNGRSLRDIAAKTGVSCAQLSKMEVDPKTSPHPSTLRKLARYYDVPMVDMLRWAGYLDDGAGKQAKTYHTRAQPVNIVFYVDAYREDGTLTNLLYKVDIAPEVYRARDHYLQDIANHLAKRGYIKIEVSNGKPEVRWEDKQKEDVFVEEMKKDGKL